MGKKPYMRAFPLILHLPSTSRPKRPVVHVYVTLTSTQAGRFQAAAANLPLGLVLLRGCETMQAW